MCFEIAEAVRYMFEREGSDLERLLTVRIDARTGEVGSLLPRRGLRPLELLPNGQSPAAAFIGISRDAAEAIFLVSSEVSAVGGDGAARDDAGSCRLVALAPNQAETFLYRPDGRTYGVELLRIGGVATAERPVLQ